MLRPSLLTRWLPNPPSATHHLIPRTILRPQPSLLSTSSRTTLRPPLSIPRRSPLTRPFSASTFRASAQPSGQSLSQRLKSLSREYGWSALGVYLLLSAMDFPFCFAAVHFLGADRIGHYEAVVVDSFKAAAGTVFPSLQEQQQADIDAAAADSEAVKEEAKAAEEKKKAGEEASLWTQIVFAYAIHKSLIVFRVPLTAAITPKVVKALRHWGWDLVKGKPRGM
ncbi:hypothetical protein HFD88_003383 [Aspergillus terreus]|nr:hypothetical protein HFD88_003383 [Aspergillus terreus]